MEFIRNNILLIAVAVVSGLMLLWPLMRRATGGPWVSAQQATSMINREDALIVYCQSGERAPKAAAALRAQGFARVVNLSGGIAAWQQAGLPVEK